jgi:hypothetical protein
MSRDDAIKAVDDAFAESVKHLYDLLAQGLISGEPEDKLADRFRKGLAFHGDARVKATAIIEEYFNRLT